MPPAGTATTACGNAGHPQSLAVRCRPGAGEAESGRMTQVNDADQPPGLDPVELAVLLDVQDGVVSRRQLRELGAHAWDVRRLLRRRELVVVHPGVYVNHTGELTSRQRRWAAVHAHWPAALAMESVMPGHLHDAVVQIAVAHGRTVRAMPRVRVHRLVRFDSRVRWQASPPAMRLEDAAIELALRASDLLSRFEVLAAACRSRQTTAERLTDEVRKRRRLPNRELLLDMLCDISTGACSVLERECLRLEERHGLPVGNRQRPTAIHQKTGYQDVAYRDQAMVVELDGRTTHGDDPLTWDDDHERDLRTAVDRDELTVRLSYGQVFRHGCRTATAIAELLARRGWDGEFRKCADCPSE